MLTAGITAAVAAVLGLFGIKPGAYLVAVALGVKITIVTTGVIFAGRWVRRRSDKRPTGNDSAGQSGL